MAAAVEPTNNAGAPPASPAAPPAKGGRSRRKQIRWAVIAAFMVVAAVVGWHYWRQSGLYVTTDNGYVQANQVEVAAQVNGTVTEVHVRDQQAVKAGDALFEIDPRNFQIALDRARAQLELARQSVSQESAGVASAEAVLAQRHAEASNASAAWDRNRELMKSGFLSPQGAENARTQLATAQAAVKAAEAGVAQAKSALGKGGEDNAAVQAAAAMVKQAEIDLERTRVVAPTNGTIANLSLRPGNTVAPNVPLFVVISDQEFWVDANFKETQLKEIRVGQKATIESDVYPDHPFHGVVQSVSGGSGAAFSLLPPQNATGNWVKVTQRVPVRIRVEDPDPQHPLRIGTTATVKVRKED